MKERNLSSDWFYFHIHTWLLEGVKVMTTISACLIVKNEEQVLGRCLDCLKQVADEIIIVDTGSTDNTMQIAKEYTDQVYEFAWKNDFSAARNFSFSKANMDYIYVADADEVMDEENIRSFRRLKEELLPEIEIVQMYYTNQLKHNTTYNYDRELRPKLYKRLRSFTWVDPLHESVSLTPVIYDSDIEIIHMPTGSHVKRDFHVLHEAVKERGRLSKKLNGMYARELFIAGESEDFKEALDYFKSLLEEVNDLEEIKKYQCVVARACLLIHDFHQFFKVCLKNIALGEPASEICYELGEYYFLASDYKEASIWYYNAAYETNAELNIHYQGDYPLKRLAECYELLGNKEEAESYRRLAKEWKVKE